MLRVLLGIIKGGVIGAVVGFGATRLGFGSGGSSFLVYGLVGVLVGLICGQAIWRQDTAWTPILKGVFGAGIAMGLNWVAHKALGGLPLPVTLPPELAAPNARLVDVPVALAPAIGILYGVFVEVDDGGARKEDAKAA